MTGIPLNLYPELYPSLNIAATDIVEGAAGPGRRFAVWLQGCLKHCPGCANGPFLPRTHARVVTPERLLSEFYAAGPLDGLTLSGGEPVLQASALIPVLKEVHQRGHSVVCYTGYEIESLRVAAEAPELAEFLSLVDLLIDGEYRSDLPRGGVLCPSANQKLHFLSSRIPPESCFGFPETVVRIAGSGASLTGTLPREICGLLFQKLRRMGIVVTPS